MSHRCADGVMVHPEGLALPLLGLALVIGGPLALVAGVFGWALEPLALAADRALARRRRAHR